MNKLQANLCLLAVTLCWSCEVIIFSVIPNDVNPFATTCITSLIGVAIMGVCFAGRIRAAFAQDGKVLVRRIVALSVMNTTYNVLSLVGLDYFDVSTGSFTLSMTVVVLPVMLLAMKRGTSVRTWISAACVLAGIIVAVYPTVSLPQLPGLTIMAAGCIVRAFYIVKLNDFAREHDPVTLAAGISGVNAVIAFVPWCVMQPTTFAALPWSTQLIAAYVIYAYFIVSFATILNIFAQRRATAAQSTIIYSTEIVFSTIWACSLPASIVTPVELNMTIVLGCALVVAGNLVEIAPIGRREKAAVAQDEDKGKALAAAQGEQGEAIAVSGVAPDTGGASQVSAAQSTFSGGLRSPFARQAILFAVLLGAYLAFALPFKALSIIPGFTDIRPVQLLQPVYGIFFGIPGCFAFAVGNLIGDILSDELRWSSIAGFIANFAYPYLMYVFWCKVRKQPFDLRTMRTIAIMAVLVVALAVMQAVIITPAVAFIYPDVDIRLFATSVISNDAVFPLLFGIPLIILMQEELNFKPK